MLRIVSLTLLFALQQAPATPILDALIKEIEAIRAGLIVPPPSPATTVTVTTAAELQAALDGPATVVQVQPGTYTGNFTIRPKPTKTLVRGLTVTASRATPDLPYPKLVAQDPLKPVINAADGAHDYTFTGLEIYGVAKDRDAIIIGRISMTEPTQVPANITFDKVYVHGIGEGGELGHRGFQFNVSNGTISNSYISGFVEQGRDSQAIGVGVGPGPYLFENNYLEGSGENMIFGGSDPKIPGMRPSKAVVRGNTFYKPPIWKTKYPGSVKNLFEIKNGDDILVEGNTFENTWVDAQPGSAIVLTTRNQDGACPWCNITNVVFRCNQVRNVENFSVNIQASDNNQLSGSAENLTIERNLFENVANGLQITGPTTRPGLKGLTVTGNVWTGIKGRFMSLDGPPTTELRFTDNATGPGLYGITGSGVGVGLPALTKFAPDAVFTGNTIETTTARTITYPPGNTLVAPGTVTAARWTGCPAR